MRAAEDQRVDVALDQRGKVFPGDALHLGAGRLSALDQLDETRTRLLEQLDVLAGHRDRAHIRPRRHGERGADHPDTAVTRRLHGCSNGRFDHFDQRDVRIRVADVVQAGARRRVAGDDEHLHAFVDEQPCDVVHVTADFVALERPIRTARGIAVIDDRLPREVVEQRARNGQSADARVENADWPIVHRSKYTGAMLRPKHAFQALHRRSEVAAVRARREVLPSSVG